MLIVWSILQNESETPYDHIIVNLGTSEILYEELSLKSND